MLALGIPLDWNWIPNFTANKITYPESVIFSEEKKKLTFKVLPSTDGPNLNKRLDLNFLH